MKFDPEVLKRSHRKLSPAQKKLVHVLVILWIAVSLWHEGGGSADWSFLLLSIMCEVS